MNCKEIRPLLSAYHDGEVTPDERKEVERHLVGCADCRHALAEYRAIGSDLRSMAVPAPPAGLRRDVWRAIEAQQARPRVFSGAASPTSRTAVLPNRNQPSFIPAMLGVGASWARAIPAALVLGGLLVVMSLILLSRQNFVAAAVDLQEKDAVSDYGQTMHVIFNKSVNGSDVERYTTVRELLAQASVPVETENHFTSTGGTTGVLEIKPRKPWQPGHNYVVHVDALRIGRGVSTDKLGDKPVELPFSASTYTPTATNTSTVTPTPTNTPLPTDTPIQEKTPQPTAVAGETILPARTPETTVVVAGQASPTARGGAPSPTTGSSRPSPTVPTRASSTPAPRSSATPVAGTSTPQQSPAASATPRPAVTAEPSQTPSASQTSVSGTPTHKPTATATSTPRVTPKPTTTASPTPSSLCSIVPVRGFGKVWREYPSVRDRAGCPLAVELPLTSAAEQRFENGYMFWKGDTRTIYVFIGGAEDRYGVWREFPDTWRDTDPTPVPVATPPAGKYLPVRGFAKVWYNNEQIRLSLGFAIEPETSTMAVWQGYDHAHALWTADKKIHFLYTDGIWARFEDTFNGNSDN